MNSRLTKTLSEYPIISSLSLTGLSELILHKLTSHEFTISNLVFRVIAEFLGTYVLFKSLDKLKEPVLKNTFSLLINSPEFLIQKKKAEQRKDFDGLINILERQRRYFKNEHSIDLQIGSVYIAKGEFETGIDYFRRSFTKFPDNFNFLEKLVNLSLKKQAEEKVITNPTNLEHYFDLIDLGLRSGDIDESIKNWERICSLDLKEKIDLNVLYSLFLDSINENKDRLRKAGKLTIIDNDEQWRKTIELILERNLNFNNLPESRNEVLELGPSQFLRSTFIFKRGKNNTELKKGYDINRKLYCLDKKIKLARPLGFFNVNTYDYDVSQRKPLRNLEQAFDNSSDDEKSCKLKLALQNQCRIHSISKDRIHINGGIYFDDIEIKEYSYSDNLDRRLLNRLGRSYEGEKFAEILIGEIPNPAVRTLIHSDAAISNFLEDGTQIDWEKSDFGNPNVSNATTLEDPKNGNVNRIEIFKENLKEYKILEREFLEESYDVHGVFISACQVGSKLNQNDVKRAIGFQRQILDKGSSNVKDQYVKYVRSLDNSKVKALQEAL